MPRKRTARRSTRRRRKGGADTAGVLGRNHELYFTKKSLEDYEKITRDLNADDEFSEKYHAIFARYMIRFVDRNNVPRVWIYNTAGNPSRGYLKISEDDYTPDELSYIASVYHRFLA